jgi:hypothetical protein
MTKLDINGNTVTTNRNYLLGVLRNMGLGKAFRDDYGRMLVPTADGGQIIFFEEDEPQLIKNWGR